MVTQDTFHTNKLDKPLINIESEELGLIFLRLSGIYYSNQTGGVQTNHPYVEGVYVPLGEVGPVFGKLRKYCEENLGYSHWTGISNEVAHSLDSLFKEDKLLSNLQVDRQRLNESEEAWIYVKVKEIRGDHKLISWSGLGDCDGVLTWPNSD